MRGLVRYRKPWTCLSLLPLLARALNKVLICLVATHSAGATDLEASCSGHGSPQSKKKIRKKNQSVFAACEMRGVEARDHHEGKTSPQDVRRIHFQIGSDRRRVARLGALKLDGLRLPHSRYPSFRVPHTVMFPSAVFPNLRLGIFRPLAIGGHPTPVQEACTSNSVVLVESERRSHCEPHAPLESITAHSACCAAMTFLTNLWRPIIRERMGSHMDRPMSVMDSPQSDSLPLRLQADLRAFKSSASLGDSPILVNS